LYDENINFGQHLPIDQKLLLVCLLLFSAESFVFQFATQKVKDQDI